VRGWSGVLVLSICSSSVSCSSKSVNDIAATLVSNVPNAAMSSLHLEYIACTLERSPCDLGNDVTNKLSWSFVGMSLFLSGRVATLTRSRLNLFRKRCEWVSIVSRLTH
jgi:hypothetical protein